jgi:protein associated with RNAse G/E
VSTGVRITVLKYDQRPHYSWDTHRLMARDGTVAVGRPGPRELVHHSKGQTFTFASTACELFWPGLPFSLGLSLAPGAEAVRFYCNIHQPALIEPQAIRFVDLDLDVIRNLGHPAEIADPDEFDVLRQRYGYPAHYTSSVPAVAEALRAFLQDHPNCDPQRLVDLLLPIQRGEVLRDRALGTFAALDSAVRRHPWPSL